MSLSSDAASVPLPVVWTSTPYPPACEAEITVSLISAVPLVAAPLTKTPLTPVITESVIVSVGAMSIAEAELLVAVMLLSTASPFIVVSRSRASSWQLHVLNGVDCLISGRDASPGAWSSVTPSTGVSDLLRVCAS